MASINQLGSGLWRARVRRQGFQTQSKSFTLKADAEAWARKLESEQERGTWRDNSGAERITLREALDRYGREITAAKRGAEQEQSVLRKLREARIAGQALARIGSQDVAALRDAWKRAGLKPATIHRRMTVLRHVFSVAAREWGMPALVNPARGVYLEPEDNARDRRVSEAEIETLCAVTESVELPPFIHLAVETAMRRSELCRLCWEHLDLPARTAHVIKAKNSHPRDVPLTRRAIGVLNALPHRAHGRVFSMRPDSFSKAFKRAAARAGLENVTEHDLRHEAISRMAGKLQLHELTKISGHRDPRMLMRYYHPRTLELAEKLD
jgi:integrase